MKLIPWILLALGIVLFFEAPDQLLGWVGMMTAIAGGSYLVYKWGRNTGYPPEAG